MRADAKRMVSKWSRKSTDPAGIDHWVTTVKRGRKCAECRRKIYPGEQSLRYIDQHRPLSFRSKKGNNINLHVERALCKQCAQKALINLMDGLNRPLDMELHDKSVKRNEERFKKLNPETEW